MTTYDIPPDEWMRILRDIVGDLSAETLIGIPGLYEVLNEQFNNDIIDQWVEEQGDGE